LLPGRSGPELADPIIRRDSLASQNRVCYFHNMKLNDIANWKELGQRIAAARKARGVSQAALGEPLGLDRSAVSRIESGGRGVDTLELARIAAALCKPVDWFVLGLRHAITSRRDADAGLSVLQGDELLETIVRDVESLVSIRSLRVSAPLRRRYRLRNLQDAERFAGSARKQLGHLGPILDLSDAVERLGLLAFSLQVGRGSLVGAYVNIETAGVALVNGDMPGGRRRFALVHELGHHLLRDDFDTTSDVPSTRGEREKLLDAFAIHFLLPRRTVRNRWVKMADEGLEQREAAIHLGHEYGVSWSALTAQLRNLELIDEVYRERLAARVPSKSELIECGLRSREDLVPPALPICYSTAVLRAFRKHKISAGRAIEMLHGTVDYEDLPEPNTVPLESFAGDLEPLA
jgi:Zn-dependent peptidase ImmA (M78 family)/DNA-binding XRE family transcriptional regulator